MKKITIDNDWRLINGDQEKRYRIIYRQSADLTGHFIIDQEHLLNDLKQWKRLPYHIQSIYQSAIMRNGNRHSKRCQRLINALNKKASDKVINEIVAIINSKDAYSVGESLERGWIFVANHQDNNLYQSICMLK